MSTTNKRDRRSWRKRVKVTNQLPLLVALVLLWVLLWEDLSVGNLLSGTLVAVAVTRLFYLPPVELSGRFNLYWALVFAGHFAVDLVKSSWQVARNAFTPQYVPSNAVIGVSLHTSSDLLMTVTAQALTLIPGSLIIEADRKNTTLYIHVLDVADDEEVEEARRNVWKVEERLIRAIGSSEECALLNRERRSSGRRPVGR